jgi:hypothetical protein
VQNESRGEGGRRQDDGWHEKRAQRARGRDRKREADGRLLTPLSFFALSMRTRPLRSLTR